MEAKILQLALEALNARKAEIEKQIAEIETELGNGDGSVPFGKKPSTKGGRQRKRSASERKAMSEKAKEIWAKRKAEKSK